MKVTIILSLCLSVPSIVTPFSIPSASLSNRLNFFYSNGIELQRYTTSVGAVAPGDAVENMHATIDITEVEIEIITTNVCEKIDLPMIPNAMEKIIVKQVVTAFVEVGPEALPDGLFNRLIAGQEDMSDLAQAAVIKISDKIDIPLISKEVQDTIVRTVSSALFSTPATDAVKRQMAGRAIRAALNADSRGALAERIDQMVDIPFMGEATEQNFILKLVDTASSVFETLVPPSIRDVLQSTSPDELREVRTNLTDRLTKKITIPFKTKEEEKVYFEILIDFLLSRYGLEAGTKEPQDELEDVLFQLEKVEIELEAQRMINEAKMQDYMSKKTSLLARKEQLSEIMKG